MSHVTSAAKPEIQGWECIIRPTNGIYGICLEKDRLARCCPLDKIPGDLEYPISSSLGKLDTLPLELLNAVFLYLDIQSLTNLRRVSQRSRFALDALPQYRILQEHAPELLRAAIGLEISKSTLIADLFKALTCQTCYLCGDFGPFIYLLSCNRVCSLCLSQNSELCPLRVSQARDLYSLDKQTLAGLPKLRSLPGKYSRFKNSRKNRIDLIDRAAATRAGIAVHGSSENVKKAFEIHKAEIRSKNDKKMEQYMVKRRLDPTLRLPTFPQVSESHDEQGHDPRRFMGIIRVPWVDPVSKRKERGVQCQGCERDMRIVFGNRTRDFHPRRMYNQAGFLQHLKECVAIYPNERWPDPLDSLLKRERKNVRATCYREAYDELQLLDPNFIDKAKLLVISLQSSCQAKLLHDARAEA